MGERYYVPYSYETKDSLFGLVDVTRNDFTFHDGPLETEDDINELRQSLTMPDRQRIVLLPWRRIQ